MRYFSSILCFCIIFLIACEENEPEKIPPIPKVRSEIAASAAIMDSVSVAPNTVDTVAILDTLKTITLSILSCDTIKTAYEKAKDKEKKYIEGVVLEAFEGIAIEAAAIELFREGNWAQIHVDYYDGMPIGCKRFYTFKGELVAVEHIVLEEIINESGSKIEELLTQVNFYRKDSLLKVDFKDKATATEQSTWQEEQKKDWEVIQQYL